MTVINKEILKSTGRCTIANQETIAPVVGEEITYKHTSFYILNDDPGSKIAVVQVEFWCNPSSEYDQPAVGMSIAAIPKNPADKLAEGHYLLPHATYPDLGIDISRLLGRNSAGDKAYVLGTIFSPIKEQASYRQFVNSLHSPLSPRTRIGSQCRQDILQIVDIACDAIKQYDGRIDASQLGNIGNDPKAPILQRP